MSLKKFDKDINNYIVDKFVGYAKTAVDIKVLKIRNGDTRQLIPEYLEFYICGLLHNSNGKLSNRTKLLKYLEQHDVNLKVSGKNFSSVLYHNSDDKNDIDNNIKRQIINTILTKAVATKDFFVNNVLPTETKFINTVMGRLNTDLSLQKATSVDLVLVSQDTELKKINDNFIASSVTTTLGVVEPYRLNIINEAKNIERHTDISEGRIMELSSTYLVDISNKNFNNLKIRSYFHSSQTAKDLRDLYVVLKYYLEENKNNSKVVDYLKYIEMTIHSYCVFFEEAKRHDVVVFKIEDNIIYANKIILEECVNNELFTIDSVLGLVDPKAGSEKIRSKKDIIKNRDYLESRRSLVLETEDNDRIMSTNKVFLDIIISTIHSMLGSDHYNLSLKEVISNTCFRSDIDTDTDRRSILKNFFYWMLVPLMFKGKNVTLFADALIKNHEYFSSTGEDNNFILDMSVINLAIDYILLGISKK